MQGGKAIWAMIPTGFERFRDPFLASDADKIFIYFFHGERLRVRMKNKNGE